MKENDMTDKKSKPKPADAPAAAPPAADPVVTAPAADGFAAPTVYSDAANGGSGNLDFNDPDD